MVGIIASFCLGLIFGGITVAAVSMNELHRLRKQVKEEVECQ